MEMQYITVTESLFLSFRKVFSCLIWSESKNWKVNMCSGSFDWITLFSLSRLALKNVFYSLAMKNEINTLMLKRRHKLM